MGITRSVLEAACEQASLRRSAAAGAIELGGGYRNANFRLGAGGETLVLRFYRDPAAARREAALHRLVRDDVPVAEILNTGVVTHTSVLPFALLRYVPGVLLETIVGGGEAEAVGQAGSVVAEVMSAIHGHDLPGSGYLADDLTPLGAPTAEANGIISTVRGRLLDARSRRPLGAEAAGQIVDILERNRNLLDAVGPETSLVHCDFNPKNIIMRRIRGRWTVAAVLDWEFAFAGSPLWDAANMLRFSDGYHPAFVEAFSTTFERSRQLPADWRAVGRMMDTVNLAELLGGGPTDPLFEPARNVFLDMARRGSF
jgi:Ser/Thr protein kinase RdoA (MazF antagonist)